MHVVNVGQAWRVLYPTNGNWKPFRTQIVRDSLAKAPRALFVSQHFASLFSLGWTTGICSYSCVWQGSPLHHLVSSADPREALSACWLGVSHEMFQGVKGATQASFCVCERHTSCILDGVGGHSGSQNSLHPQRLTIGISSGGRK